jgi:ribonuclease P protein component
VQAGARLSRRATLLTGQGAFDTVFRGGRRIEGRYLQLVAMPAAHPPGRTGFVIGGKALPHAVDRNRIRRQLREIVRAHRPALNAFDVILRVKAAPKPIDHDAVSGEAPRLLAKLLADAPA